MSTKLSPFLQWLALLLLMPLLAVLAYGLVDLLIAPLDGTAVNGPGGGVNTAVPYPTVTPIPATATPLPVGYSRTNPHPVGSTVHMRDWEVATVGNIIRGDEAWRILQEANYFNDPPPDGSEYLLVQFRLAHTRQTGEEQYLALHVTGSQNVLHYSFDNGEVPPEPVLDTTLPARGKSEGWEAYTIAAGERNLVVMIEDLHNYDEMPQYLSLTDDLAPVIPYEKLREIQPNDVGGDPAHPAALGQTVLTNFWQVTVLEMTHGEAAWQQLLETNRYNDPPPTGMEYVLCRVQVRYLGLVDEPALVSRFSHFWAQSGQGEATERLPIVVPEPELDIELFPGGEFTGWLAFLVAVDDPTPLLVFEPDVVLPEEAAERYFAVVRDGR